MSIIIKNIKQLLQIDNESRLLVKGSDMKHIDLIEDAWLLVQGEKIEDFGSMSDFNENDILKNNPDIDIIDAKGKMLMPAFVDSHTHLVYPASREIEYIDKIKGLSYEEIAKRGGGILNTAKKTQQISEDELFESSLKRLNEIASYGTGAVEIKSGYGLTLESELKMLRVIKKLKAASPLTIKSNFLGAHSIPLEYRGRQSEYVDLVVNEMIPKVAEEDLADFIDVFCDIGFFTVEDTERILKAGQNYGLRAKIHANELDYSGGVQVGVKYNALSVDHLEFVGDEEIKTMLNSETIPTVLPGAAFFLGMKYAPAREMIDAGLPLAMASDFNPGSSPSGNMQLILSMACILYKLLPEEAINSTTLNTAYAMGVSDKLGTITKGKLANLIITKEIPTYEYLPYYYGTNKVDTMIIKGRVVDIKN
ncbi:MAG: imidazolonepropionase [Marinilabiliales bacterium]|nr:MAG: imidazolonepropionase [Marinilabiliales bacterium]